MKQPVLHEDPEKARRLNEARRYVLRKFAPRKMTRGMQRADYLTELDLTLWKAGQQWDPKRGSLFNFAVHKGRYVVREAELYYGYLTRPNWDRKCSGEEVPAEYCPPVSLTTLLALEDADADMIAALIDTRSNPETQTLCHSEGERVWAAMDGLEPRERMVLTLYYGEELLQEEIGRRMGLSRSRISQIRQAALQRLREILEADHAA